MVDTVIIRLFLGPPALVMFCQAPRRLTKIGWLRPPPVCDVSGLRSCPLLINTPDGELKRRRRGVGGRRSEG